MFNRQHIIKETVSYSNRNIIAMFSLPHEIHTCFLHVNKHIRGWERCSYPRNRFCNTHRANLPCETMSLSRHGVWLMYSESQAGGPAAKGTELKTRDCPRRASGEVRQSHGKGDPGPLLSGRKEDQGYGSWAQVTGLQFNSAKGQESDPRPPPPRVCAIVSRKAQTMKRW